MQHLTKIDTNKIRYLVAFEKFTGVKTIECFEFNEAIIFVVNPALLKMIMAKRSGIKNLSDFLNKRIKVLAIPLHKDYASIEKFINALIAPHSIKSVVIENSKLVINAGMSKAMILGREKKNIPLLREIFKKYFGIEDIQIR